MKKIKLFWTNNKTKILNNIFMLFNVVLIILLFETFGTKGFIFFIMGFALIGIIRLWQYRENFMNVLRGIETMIFGSPQEKEYKEQLKNTKVKFRWRRKKKK